MGWGGSLVASGWLKNQYFQRHFLSNFLADTSTPVMFTCFGRGTKLPPFCNKSTSSEPKSKLEKFLNNVTGVFFFSLVSLRCWVLLMNLRFFFLGLLPTVSLSVGLFSSCFLSLPTLSCPLAAPVTVDGFDGLS